MTQIPIFDEVEKQLGLDTNLILSLQKEDDWSFIIKCHSLIEAVINHSLSRHINNQDFDRHLRSLNLNGRSGRVELSSNLNILKPELKKFVEAFSEIRNEFVHSIESINSSISSYFDGLNNDQKNHFLNRISFVCNLSNPINLGFESPLLAFKEKPREVIFYGLSALITVLVVSK